MPPLALNGLIDGLSGGAWRAMAVLIGVLLVVVLLRRRQFPRVVEKSECNAGAIQSGSDAGIPDGPVRDRSHRSRSTPTAEPTGASGFTDPTGASGSTEPTGASGRDVRNPRRPAAAEAAPVYAEADARIERLAELLRAADAHIAHLERRGPIGPARLAIAIDPPEGHNVPGLHRAARTEAGPRRTLPVRLDTTAAAPARNAWPRERVEALLKEGRRPAQIARALGVTVGEVELARNLLLYHGRVSTAAAADRTPPPVDDDSSPRRVSVSGGSSRAAGVPDRRG